MCQPRKECAQRRGFFPLITRTRPRRQPVGKKPIGQRDQKEKYENPHQRSHEFPFVDGPILWSSHKDIPSILLYATRQSAVNLSSSQAWPLQVGAGDRTERAIVPRMRCIQSLFHGSMLTLSR